MSLLYRLPLICSLASEDFKQKERKERKYWAWHKLIAAAQLARSTPSVATLRGCLGLACPIVTQGDIITYDCFNLWCYRPRSQRPSQTVSPLWLAPCRVTLVPHCFPCGSPHVFSLRLFPHCFPSGSSHTVSQAALPTLFPCGPSHTGSPVALPTLFPMRLFPQFPLRLSPHCFPCSSSQIVFPTAFPPSFSLWLFMLGFPCGSSRIISPVALPALFPMWLFSRCFPVALPTSSFP